MCESLRHFDQKEARLFVMDCKDYEDKTQNLYRQSAASGSCVGGCAGSVGMDVGRPGTMPEIMQAA
jgi:hypothetical protein